MGRVGKGKTLINISMPNGLRDIIDQRAQALRLSRATYALMIVEKWETDGYPAVSEPDYLVQLSRKTKKK